MFKIQTIELLETIKDKGIEELKIQIPLLNISYELIAELSALLSENVDKKAKTRFCVEVIDPETRWIAKLNKKDGKITVNKPIFHFLKEKKENQILDFIIS